MEQTAINKEECEKLESQWTNMADWYAKNIEVASTQGMVTCAVMANMPQCKRVIEVACDQEYIQRFWPLPSSTEMVEFKFPVTTQEAWSKN